ncbi:periplasmic heme lyase subunit with CcmH, transfers heme from CcmE to apocytochrome c, cytochrome c-type biogenesis [Cupriavidus taiwanensis]|uniref:Periplasmic heme lyase subunit with CcmH, transfers heme from CcmE to apocytochrome c, cytochrome c-type biogenesis n=1 Tax=Cupriavidus taiwanensis TaxID=164546 RepID=A0A375EFM7_9BURK|nr:heme lyase CcmF/NrfE family subunit [Cupriavidus taiwanensis]SOZ62672.1 periplasmic heme lyase subunit with CcmH, transfers heme from CcmE to apocytochrome c, cytochrome c-type biogenesis [Cupriavidus taiwanensis]SOZ62914.1 periplasmic heme lyase subunit with CcmH, transfers heme from CcmE to apocytochrome c, cytochrome c-type biogenesis [Cupriavidus taiwanensis]SOZ73965.1 periplasmic heme lyase subunit with CcmH, transfers heme from CcmE to apocytochrome c, cytochrome c-type biogenesis [Cupr
MIAELGHFTLIVALLVALVQAVVPLAGAARGRLAWMALARPAARVQCGLVALSFAALTWCFVDHDFSVRYVAANANSALPLAYRIAAVWGGHEGSMLLWTLMLALWSLAVSVWSRQLPLAAVARVLAVMGAISAGFLAFLLFASNPFVRLLPPAMEGRDLNPLLQDPGMVFHPPLLYMGYVGFSVTFAFAVAALLAGRVDAAWARWSRPWTTVAWAFLTLGIMLGSAWAYYELGWGGWWFWDPVENASFMPWLAGTALMHSLAVTEKRGAFRAWTVLLAIFTFSLSLLGTFLVRSGVLTSVHAFAVDPKRGIFILALLGLVTGLALALYAWRAPALARRVAFAAVSRESMLLANNVLLAVAAATVLLGTLYPLLVDVLGLGKISVGPAYFEQVMVPLMAPAVLLMGAAPLARWRHGDLPGMARRLRWAAVASAALALALLLALRNASALSGLGLLLAAWCVLSAVASVAARLQPQRGRRLAALRQFTPGYWGMLLAHAGVGVFIAGVTLVCGQESLRELPMRAGDSVSVGGYAFRFAGVTQAGGPNYDALRGTLVASRDGRRVAVLHPERRIYRSQDMPTTEAAIDSGVTRDLYVALGEHVGSDAGGSAWAVRIHVKPFVGWIWAGCVLMALGGLLAVCDKRYRLRRRATDAVNAPAPTDAPAVPALTPVREETPA